MTRRRPLWEPRQQRPLPKSAGQAQRPAPARQNVEWKPRLGILGPYSEANVKFAHDEGFTNMILGAPKKPAPGGAT